MATIQHRIAVLRALASNSAATPGERAAALIALEIHDAKLKAGYGDPKPPRPHPSQFPASMVPKKTANLGTANITLSFDNYAWTLVIKDRGFIATWPGSADYYVDYGKSLYMYGNSPWVYPKGPQVLVTAKLQVPDSDVDDLEKLFRSGHDQAISILIGKGSGVSFIQHAMLQSLQVGQESVFEDTMSARLDLVSYEDLAFWDSEEAARNYTPGRPKSLSQDHFALTEKFS